MKRKSKIAFYDLNSFPQLEPLADGWLTMAVELATLNAPVMNIHRVGKAHDVVEREVRAELERGEKYGWVLGWGDLKGNQSWVQYGLVVRDEIVPFAAMPKTQALFRGMKGVKVAALARLAPMSFLPTHTHPELAEEGLLQLHVVIEAPSGLNLAYLNVNGEFRKHLLGEAFVFDGSLPHFAVNGSMERRTILYVEFECGERG